MKLLFTFLTCLLYLLPATAQLSNALQKRMQLSATLPGLPQSNFLRNEHNFFLRAAYQNRWNRSLEQAQQFTFVDVNYMPGELFKHVWQDFGLHLAQQDSGPLHVLEADLKFALRIKWAEFLYKGGISFGLSPGLIQYRLQPDQLRPYHLNDKLLDNAKATDGFLRLSAGVFAHQTLSYGGRQDNGKIYFGLGIRQWGTWRLNPAPPGEAYSWKPTPQFHYVLGYIHYLRDNYCFFEFNFWWNQGAFNDGVLRQYWDSNVRCFLINTQNEVTFWFGGGYQESDLRMVHGEIGITLPNEKMLSLSLGSELYFQGFGQTFSAYSLTVNYSFEKKSKKDSQKP